MNKTILKFFENSKNVLYVDNKLPERSKRIIEAYNIKIKNLKSQNLVWANLGNERITEESGEWEQGKMQTLNKPEDVASNPNITFQIQSNEDILEQFKNMPLTPKYKDQIDSILQGRENKPRNASRDKHINMQKDRIKEAINDGKF